MCVLVVTTALSIERARGYVRLAKSDSLVRNSFFMMASTAVTAGLGYVFWIVTAHIFTKAEVGVSSAVISLSTTVALLTYLGPWAMLVQRLHAYEHTALWTRWLVRVSAATAVLTAATAALAVFALGHAADYGQFFVSPLSLIIAIAGATAWTLVNLLSAAFVAARRADGQLTLQALVSVAKVLIVAAAGAAGIGATGIVAAWVGSALLGVAAGALWLIPSLRLGRPRAGSPLGAPEQPRRGGAAAADRRRSRRRDLAQLLGQHLTSVGGAAVPLLLPIIVFVRLGAVPNAYFYVTWMVGSVFFTISPSVSAALFAESVRVNAGLRSVVRQAFRLIAVLLLPMMAVMIGFGRLVLGLFGHAYADAGYWLLVLLALSAVPDAVSNIAVAVFRVTGRLQYSAALNLGILVMTVSCAWFMLPSLGVLGAGVAWLAAQVFGAVASLPAYARARLAAEPGA